MDRCGKSLCVPDVGRTSCTFSTNIMIASMRSHQAKRGNAAAYVRCTGGLGRIVHAWYAFHGWHRVTFRTHSAPLLKSLVI
ncbi:hypothetical protein WL00_07850 [Burkholderia cepacia]|nr:hypothetical protein WL00_07850 [Burkholderia cepacia]